MWKSLSEPAPHQGDGVAVYMYVVFAWVVLPILAPLAILLVERDRRRRNAMWIFVALGSVAGVYLLGAVMSNDITAHIAEHTIQYGGAGRLRRHRHRPLRDRDVWCALAVELSTDPLVRRRQHRRGSRSSPQQYATSQ